MKLLKVLYASIAILYLCAILSAPARAQLSMLHVSGQSIVNASGATVQLRGVNLGDWLVIEPWMCPGVSASDANGSFQDEHSILASLDSRFGVATEQSLIATYQNAYITTADLQNIHAQGLNVIRVPVWWGDFYTLGTGTGGIGTWRSDAFTKLDWVVSQAAALGIYTIIDMHGAIGQQSNDHSTGWQNQNQYWGSSADQAATNTMWQQIAIHYAGNANVAAYDILNEPDNPPSDAAVISAYVGLMQAIRASDPNHICCIEGTFDAWDWSMLPNPSTEGWTNVIYEMHQYNGSGAGNYSAAQGQVTDWHNHSAYNVPDYIGEFNPANNSTDPNTGLSYWQDVINLYSSNNISWTLWTYKAGGTATQGGNWGNNWGLYQPNQNVTIPTPSIATDSSATIQTDWAALTTSNYFVLNTNISNAVVGGNPPAPSAPTGLTATAGNTQATLSWSASAGAATYNVYRGTTAGGEGATAISTGLTGTSFTNAGLTNGTTYYYEVAAVNAAGTSPMSNEASVVPNAPVEAPFGGTAAPIPGTVQAENYDTGGQGLAYNVTSTNGTDNGYRADGVDLETCSDTGGGVDMGWTATGQWFRYTVNVASAGTYTAAFRVASGASGATMHIQNAAGTNLTGTVTIPATGGWQTWVTVNANIVLPAGQQTLTVWQETAGVNINAITFTSGGISAPPAPTGLTATPGNAQNALSWTASSGATSYNVYRGTTAGGESTTAVATGLTGTTDTDTGLTNGTTYYYRVAAVNSAGTSALSTEASGRPSGPVEAPYGGTAAAVPGTVQAENYDTGGQGLGYSVASTNGSDNGYRTDGVDLEVCTDTGGGVDLGWTAAGQWFRYTVNVATAGTYTVGFRVSSGASGGTLHLQNATGTSLTGTVTVPGTGGWQTWTTVNATVTLPAGTQVLTVSQDSGGWNINLLIFSSSTAPSAPASLAATAGNTQIGLSWTASTGAASYNVYRGTSAGGESTTAIATGLTGTTYTNTGLTNGTAYYYKVAAVNSVGTSPLSVEAHATPAPSVPAAPTALSATAGNTQAALSWTASTGATSYNLYRGTTAGGESTTAIATGVTGTTYTNTGLTNGTTYYYKVAAVNSSGTSSLSVEASATPATAGNGPIANGTYTLTPQNATGARLDLTNGSTSNGNQLQIWTAAGNANQKWVFTNMDGGLYKIQPSTSTGVVVDVNGSGSGNGTIVDVWADTGTTGQRWTLTAVTGGYTLTPQCAPSTRMDVSGPSSSDGTKIQIWAATGASNQTWSIGSN